MPSFEHRGTVRWNETDASGRFHHAGALIWAEEAEHALYRQISPMVDIAAFPRRSVSATYHRPFVAGDTYRVVLELERMGTTSLNWCWQIMRGGAVAAEGTTTCVHVGEDGRPAPLPHDLRMGLTASA